MASAHLHEKSSIEWVMLLAVKVESVFGRLQVQTANSGSTERAAAANAREQPAAHPLSRTPSVGPGGKRRLHANDLHPLNRSERAV